MNCPHCGQPDSRVVETRQGPDYDRRVRQCRACAKSFQTIERVAVYGGRAIGYLEAAATLESEPEPEEEPAPIRKIKQPLPFVATADHEAVSWVTAEAQPLLLEWWNSSRRSKHGSKATWTEGAFCSSAKRVSLLPPWKQVVLCTCGIEQGWQALKADYIADAKPPADAGLTPKSTAMQEAIDSWNNRVA